MTSSSARKNWRGSLRTSPSGATESELTKVTRYSVALACPAPVGAREDTLWPTMCPNAPPPPITCLRVRARGLRPDLACYEHIH